MTNKVSKVYMNNSLSLFQRFGAKDKLSKIEVTMLIGFEQKIDGKIFREKIINDFIQNLLIHEKISISIFDIVPLIVVFGFDNILILFKSNVLEIIDDNGIRAGLVESQNEYIFTNMIMSEDSIKILDIFSKNLTSNKDILNKFILQIEKNTVNLAVLELKNLLNEEMKYDLKNQNYTSNTQLISNEIDKIDYRDAGKILRMGYVTDVTLTKIMRLVYPPKFLIYS